MVRISIALLLTACSLTVGAASDTVAFVSSAGVTSKVEIVYGAVSLDGRPCALSRGERACGPHVFSGGWVFDGMNWSIRHRAQVGASVEIPEDGTLVMGLSADWFCDISLDGRKAFSLGLGGNGTSEFGYWNHTVSLPVTRGRHTLTVEVGNGLGGMMFALGCPEPSPVRSTRPVSPEETLAACRRLWSREGDPFDRQNPQRLADLDIYQRAIDMTSGESLMAFCEGAKPDFSASPALAILNAAVDRVLDEVKTTVVEPGSIVLWYLYDMGIVVKTPKAVFCIDVSMPRDAEIADICDFACVTHNHEDHCSMRLVRRMQKDGGFNSDKPVISGFLYSKHHSRTPKVWKIRDCTVETGVADHNPFWKEAMTPLRITCGEGPDSVVLVHAGDSWDADQLSHFRPVDIVFCHVWPWDGHNGEKMARVLRPDILVLSHAQEMSHGFGPGRFDYRACEAEARRAKGANHVIYPVWGERLVYRKPVQPHGLTVEYRENPVGVPCSGLRFGWKLPTRFVRQTAYEIDADGWQSGKIASDRSFGVAWGGTPLSSSQRVSWKVRVWNENDEPSDWSEPASFVCAMNAAEDWQAKWIGASAGSYPEIDLGDAKWIVSDTTNEFRRTFVLGHQPADVAELAFAAVGEYDIYLNGIQVARTYWEHEHDWKLVRTIDVAAQLQAGTNELRAVIRPVSGAKPTFIARLRLHDAPVLVTDGHWRAVRELGGLRDLPGSTDIVSRYERLAPAFSKVFVARGAVARATLHVTGLGFYEATLNGVRVGDKVLDPAPTAYDRRVLYSTYPLEGMLREGTNELKLVLGHGWYDVRSIAAWHFDTAPWRDTPRAIARLEIAYVDGRREVLVTDESWRHVESPVAYDCIREGEISVGNPVACSKPVSVVSAPKGRLEPSPLPGARKLRKLVPKSVVSIGDAAWLVTFPENVAGWIRLRMRGLKTGQVVSVTYDERLASDGRPAAPFDWHHEQTIWASRPGVDYRDVDRYLVEGQSYRVLPGPAIAQRDRYVAAGREVEYYEPRFMYHGFRYVTIRGLAEAPSAGDIEGFVVSTDFPTVGSFRCSDATFNRMMDAVGRSYRSNFVDGYPTDCPHREKNGWMGDAAVASTLAQYLFENTAGYEKWLDDIVDAQRANGEVPGIAPTSGWGFKWGNGPVWDVALPLVAWNLWTYRADFVAVQKTYPALVRYLAFMRREKVRDGLVDWGLDDWVPAKADAKPTREYTVSCYHLRALEIASEMAKLVGTEEASAGFAHEARRVREALRAKYGKGGGVWDNGGQTAQALALEFGLCESETERSQARRQLVEAFARANDHVTMGLVGMTHAFRALSKAGRTDLAFRVLTQPTRPSPAAFAFEGGATLHESWDSDSSLNHIMFGDFAAWAYQYLAGIRPLTPGFGKILFAPEVIDALAYVEAKTDSPLGEIRSSWHKINGGIRCEFVVPGGASGSFTPRGGKTVEFGPGTHVYNFKR